MPFALSATPILALSSVLSSVEFEYTNTARKFTPSFASTTVNGVSLSSYTAFNNSKDVAINNNAMVILTDHVSLSSFLYNKKTVVTENIGFSGLSYFNKYVYQDNISVDINQAIPQQTNLLLVCPFKDNHKFTVIPLRSTMGTSNEYNFAKITTDNLTRSYDAVYFGNNQNNGYQNLYLQYQTDNTPISFDNDIFVSVYLHDKLAELPLSSTGFIENGAFGGDSPINSDVILLDQFGYNNYINTGNVTNTFNGTPLCLWLSAGNVANQTNMVWCERWYDPNTVTQGQAFITQKNTNIFNQIKDFPSTITLQPKSRISYLRFGENRNTTYINSFSSTLLCHFEDWGTALQDTTNNIEGFSVGTYDSADESIATMDGRVHFHIPANDILHDEAEITANIWVNQKSWSQGIDTQYFGNFSNNEGYGLFFNTNAPISQLIFPTISGIVFGFNHKLNKVFEKSILTSVGVSAAKIDYLTTDIFGAKWLYDSINKNIYKLDTDNLFTEKITLPATATIKKIQINALNHLYALNTKNNTISGFDIFGTTISAISLNKAYNTFEFDKNNNIVTDLADILVIDNDNDRIKAWGINLYKNDVLFFHVGHRILALNVDAENNYWLVYDSNKILKLSSDGKVLIQKTLPIFFENETNIEFNFIKEIKNNVDYDIGCIIFNNNNYVIKLDSDGNILKRINLRDVVNLKACGNFELNVKGDFTGFENKRKFFSVGDKLISSTYPAITLKINLYCGDTIAIHQLHYPCSALHGWNNVSFTHSIENRNTVLRLYVNGNEVVSKTITGVYRIYYGTRISPFIIGGHSGKLGAKNVEFALANEGYFVGQIDDVRIYGKKLSPFEIRGLTMHRHFDSYSPLIWYCPTPKYTYMEEINQYHLNRYHGNKSHKYNIKIKNMQVDDETTKSIIESSVREAIIQITPLYTELNEVIFE